MKKYQKPEIDVIAIYTTSVFTESSADGVFETEEDSFI